MAFSTDTDRSRDASGEATMPGRGPASADSWVVPFRPSGTRRPLFCARAGGGDGYEYRDLALALPDDLPVYAFGLPPRKDGEQFSTVEDLAAVYVSKVREFQAHGPYRLCGHSFGGLVVFEMARRLANDGEDVELLALLDTLNPAYIRNLSIKGQAKFRLTYIANRLARYGRHLYTGRIDKAFSDALIYLSGVTKTCFWKTVGFMVGRLGFPISKVIRNDAGAATSLAWYAYTPSEYKGKVVLFVASDRGPEYGIDRTFGWGACATGALEIHVVPGGHSSMMRPPHIQVLAEQLMPYLGSSAAA
jgi:thioesterase domain-containing protein